MNVAVTKKINEDLHAYIGSSQVKALKFQSID